MLVVALVAAIVVVIALVVIVTQFLIVKVPLEKAASFVGLGKGSIVTGGSRLWIPGLESYKFLDLAPIQLSVPLDDSESKEGVPVVLTVEATLGFARDDASLRVAFQNFQAAQEDASKWRDMMERLKGVIGSTMREVIASMTVVGLHTERETVRQKVMSMAADNLAKFGLVLVQLSYKDLDDRGNILKDLARRTSAVSKRDADKEVAEAERDSQVHAAEAQEKSAEARNKLALRQAELDTAANIAHAKAEQAGELAKQRELLAVEQQRALVVAQQQQATVVEPARAAKEAAILQADADRQSKIAAAEAEAERIRVLSKAELQSDQDRAQGQRELADTYAQFSANAVQLLLFPRLLEMLPALAERIAQQYGNIDKLVVFDGGQSRLGQSAVQALSQALEMARAIGLNVDIRELMQGLQSGQNGHRDDVPVAAMVPTDDHPADTAS